VSDSVTEERIAEVSFATAPAGLSVGEMAEVLVQLPPLRDVVLIPNAALHHLGVQPGVWRLDGGKLRFVPIKTGVEGQDGRVQVTEGLAAGDALVLYSERELSADSRIKVVSALVEAAP
jgi:HlyD family secretion protein